MARPIAEIVTEARERAGLSQSAAARRMTPPMDRRRWNDVEMGKRQPGDQETAGMLIALGVTTEDDLWREAAIAMAPEVVGPVVRHPVEAA